MTVVGVTVAGLGAYVVYNLVRGLWDLAQRPADEVAAALDRLEHADVADEAGAHPYGEYDGSRGVWCDWCWSYHRAR